MQPDTPNTDPQPHSGHETGASDDTAHYSQDDFVADLIAAGLDSREIGRITWQVGSTSGLTSQRLMDWLAWIAASRGWLTYRTPVGWPPPSGYPDVIFWQPDTGVIHAAEVRTKPAPARQPWLDEIVETGNSAASYGPAEWIDLIRFLDNPLAHFAGLHNEP